MILVNHDYAMKPPLKPEKGAPCAALPGPELHKGRSSFVWYFALQGLPWWSAGKESACNVRDLRLIPGLERSPGGGNSYSFQYSGLENSMGYFHGATKSQTRLSGFHFHFALCISSSDCRFIAFNTLFKIQ